MRKPFSFRPAGPAVRKGLLRPTALGGKQLGAVLDFRIDSEAVLSTGHGGGTGSGNWELRDDGALCVRFNAAQSGDPGCIYFFREGNHLKRTARNSPADRVGAVIEAIE